MSSPKYELIITEKEQQARDIANALSIPEIHEIIVVPTKEYLKLKVKCKSLKSKLDKKNLAIKDFENVYQQKGKQYTHLKGYEKLILQKEQWEKALYSLEEELSLLKQNLEKKKVNIWKDKHNVIISCLGHLISIKLKNRNNDLNFETELKLPSPTNPNEVKKWVKIKLIEKYIESPNLSRIICATDYDREGESIFGTIMEYFQIDLTKCFRMKFSTLEPDILREAYSNLILFNTTLFNSGKMRRWMDFVIGYNLNPILAIIYRKSIVDYLENLNLTEEINLTKESINKIKYSNTFNIGRVKLVIIDHIYEFTKEQMNIISKIENKDSTSELIEKYHFYFYDYNDNEVYLFGDYFLREKIKIENINLKKSIKLEVEEISYNEINKEIQDCGEIPSFLNLTKIFNLCSKIGASTEEINRILEYLYLQKLISYPRSKSEKWEIPDTNDRINYAHSVLDALENIGYPTKDYYYDSFGNEGDNEHSHPCIHPLPSLDISKIERLRKLNPLAFIVFNEICIYTLKCFEKLPLVKEQKIKYKLLQKGFTFGFSSTHNIELLEENILSFEGYNFSLSPELSIKKGDTFKVDVRKYALMNKELESNRKNIEVLDDFAIIDFLNRNDIGTDATRSILLNNLIELQYFVSDNILLTTFLGNTLSKLAHNFVDFINIDYTLEIEDDLDRIENGELTMEDFKDKIKEIIREVYNNMMDHYDEINEIFLKVPKCEIHNIPMIIKSGKFGKFLQCPLWYSEQHKCNQKISL